MMRPTLLALAMLCGLSGMARWEKAEAETKYFVNTTTNVATHAHTNRLAHEKSPYLLQHQFNPVDWCAWGEEAFNAARRQNRPIFLSIGYSTCHWCHVMERESFENENIAAFLNEHFVSIKVDREERPDVDKIYMSFVQATSGQGGWPLNVFLTPDLKPFYGGTYFPPGAQQGRPGFLQLLKQIHRCGPIVKGTWSVQLRKSTPDSNRPIPPISKPRPWCSRRRFCARQADFLSKDLILAMAVSVLRRNFHSRANRSFCSVTRDDLRTRRRPKWC
jgi:hypothetical protein